jgi:hypothetical protein
MQPASCKTLAANTEKYFLSPYVLCEHCKHQRTLLHDVRSLHANVATLSAQWDPAAVQIDIPHNTPLQACRQINAHLMHDAQRHQADALQLRVP